MFAFFKISPQNLNFVSLGGNPPTGGSPLNPPTPRFENRLPHTQAWSPLWKTNNFKVWHHMWHPGCQICRECDTQDVTPVGCHISRGHPQEYDKWGLWLDIEWKCKLRGLEKTEQSELDRVSRFWFLRFLWVRSSVEVWKTRWNRTFRGKFEWNLEWGRVFDFILSFK